MSERKRLLLHTCCAPCASHVIEFLAPDYDITLLFYNPNIEPYEEYLKRKEQLQVLRLNMQSAEHVRLLDCDYDHEAFFAVAEGLRNEPEGGARCAFCFRLRLSETAKYAKSNGFELFATTLTVSPHKNAELINEIGYELSKSFEIAYFSSDFKKRGGYQNSVRLSKLYGLYRQRYCGCEN